MGDSQAEPRHLNSLAPGAAENEFLKCCGSRRWARRMIEERPFTDVDQMTRTADRIWLALEPGDWLEAFHSHPKIGEKKAVQQVSEQSQAWSAHEQAGIESSAADTLKALAELNHAYEEKFGFIFIVCATGKSPEEILAILRERLGNDKDEELRIAAAEQSKITELRLRKLIENRSS